MPYRTPEQYREWRERNRQRVREYDKRRRAEKKETMTAYMREWRRNNPVMTLVSAARHRAKRKGVPFSITAEHVTIPETCPYFGIKLVVNRGRMKDNSPTIDRINSSRGYEPGNIEVISWRANRMKGDATAEEHRKIADRMDRLDNFSS